MGSDISRYGKDAQPSHSRAYSYARMFILPVVLANIKEVCVTGPLWGEPIGDRWIPLTKGQWRGKCFHMMMSPWRRVRIMADSLTEWKISQIFKSYRTDLCQGNVNMYFHFYNSSATDGFISLRFNTLRWRHNECDSVSNHQPRDCLLNRLSGRRSK